MPPVAARLTEVLQVLEGAVVTSTTAPLVKVIVTESFAELQPAREAVSNNFTAPGAVLVKFVVNEVGEEKVPLVAGIAVH